jgi:hypothetical protein
MKDAPIGAECPNCGQERVQDGYALAELVQLLRSGASVPAYCAICDAHWELSLKERSALVRALNK